MDMIDTRTEQEKERVCVVVFGSNNKLYTNAGWDDNKVKAKLSMIGKQEYVRTLKWDDATKIICQYDIVLAYYYDIEPIKGILGAELVRKYAGNNIGKIRFLSHGPIIHFNEHFMSLDKPVDENIRYLMWTYHNADKMTSMLVSTILLGYCKLLSKSLDDRLNKRFVVGIEELQHTWCNIHTGGNNITEDRNIDSSYEFKGRSTYYSSLTEYSMHKIYTANHMGLFSELVKLYYSTNEGILINSCHTRQDIIQLDTNKSIAAITLLLHNSVSNGIISDLKSKYGIKHIERALR